MKRILPFIIFFLPFISVAQDSVYARKIIDTLTSNYFNGRGYTNDGVNRALIFLKKEFETIGLKPMDGKNYLQQVSYNVNTFPGEMSLSVNGKELQPGIDFIVSPESKSIRAEFDVIQSDSIHYINPDNKFTITIADKLTFGVSKSQEDETTVIILKSSLPETPHRVKMNIESRLIQNFKTGNICGYVKGKSEADSFIVFTAHYDHLGGMGKQTFFPGANDNASGVSMLLGLAKWYAKHPQKYSIGFILFTGEEAGLVGSEFFTRHPEIELRQIRFLINLDLTGTGVEGVTVVNATVFKKEFELLTKINDEKKYLVSVNSRGKAKNSDHYYFTEKRVPSFFIYTLGGIKAYHDVYDVSATLPNNEYVDLSNLLRDFVTALIH